MYKRVLLKLSGEALSNGIDDPFSNEKLTEVASEIAMLVKDKIQVCVVIGGGNLYRGKIGVNLGMNRQIGDCMGMLATVMNSLALSNALTKNNIKCNVFSSIEMKGIVKQYDQKEVMTSLTNNEVIIFAGGTGHPFFSTDTCSALRALQTECDIILAAKNGVDGVYSSDPRLDKNATRYDTISYKEVIEKNLQVMDLTAISLCKENNMPVFVFNMNKKGNIYKACKGEVTGTIVK